MLTLGVLAVHPDMYLSELCIYIHSATGTLVSNSTICHMLKRHGYTRKKIQHIALQRCEDLRAQFVAEVVCLFSLDKFVWIDECGCSHRDAVREVGYALRGMTPTCIQLLTRKRRISCIVVMSSDGIVAVEQTQQTVGSSIFFEFVCGNLLPNSQPFDGTNSHSVVVMDNCTVHHVDEVKVLFSEAGILLLFLPPYSPDLTPIELLFSKIKYYLKQHNDIIPDPGPVITAAFNDVTSEESSLGKTLWLRSMTIYNSVLTLYRFKIITHTLTCNGMYIFYSLFSCSIILISDHQTPVCLGLHFHKVHANPLTVQCTVTSSCIVWQVKIHLNPSCDWY